ncbi:MAG TPA: hypothetical protein VFP84_22455 [Kofleriaceae bacterium]|nr:hypothetical protein [Kofleriaceae bacterium]
MSDETTELQDLVKDLPAVDVDPSSAARIAERARRDVGQRPPRARLVLPILVGLLVAITIVWALYKAFEALG